jgi:3-phenylpropionate/trans-cinnamate dioxygenase ferredoxin reductase component
MTGRTIIIGASHAGVAVAAKLRAHAPDASITLISAEENFPVQRPVLSKAYLSGKSTLDYIYLRAPEWYADNNIELIRGTNVASIDAASKSIALADGTTLSYDNLVIATGATPRRLPAEIGGHLPNVFVVRDLGDADGLKATLHEGQKLVVIGGGYIGLEAASEASKMGVSVTVLEAAERIVQRVAAKETSDVLRDLHRTEGVDIREGMQVSHIVETNGKASGVQMKDGSVVPADLVIVGIGITPNMALAAEAGLETGNGIIVDAQLRSSDPSIYALGDCAAFPKDGTLMRLESVQNAHDQGALVAANIAGENNTYNEVPWFWSDQFDLNLQIAGLNTGYDNIVVRTSEGRRAHFYFKGDKFLAVDCFNDALTFAMSRKILELGKPLTREQAGDAAVSLKSIVKG